MRDDALTHERVDDFWAVIDALGEQDPDIRGDPRSGHGSNLTVAQAALEDRGRRRLA